MNTTNLGDATTTVGEKSKNIVLQLFEQQAHSLGAHVEQTAHDLERVGSQLRASGTISSASAIVNWAAEYVSAAGTYLQSGSADSFVADMEAYGRERPWAIAASAAALGFAAARVIKSSSIRRFAGGSTAIAPTPPATTA